MPGGGGGGVQGRLSAVSGQRPAGRGVQGKGEPKKEKNSGQLDKHQ